MSATIQDKFVTATIGGQLFALPIQRVQELFVPERVMRVPLAVAEVAGLLNLRGRIHTVVDMRRRLGLSAQPHDNGGVSTQRRSVALSVEHKRESYALLIDEVGEVMQLSAADRDENPANMDAALAQASLGVHRLEGRLLVVLDVDRLLDFDLHAWVPKAAA